MMKQIAAGISMSLLATCSTVSAFEAEGTISIDVQKVPKHRGSKFNSHLLEASNEPRRERQLFNKDGEVWQLK
jgi:hypothetical protein